MAWVMQSERILEPFWRQHAGLLFFGAGSGATGTSSLAMALRTILRDIDADLKIAHAWTWNPPENCDWFTSLEWILARGLVSPEECVKKLHAFNYTSIADSVGAVLDSPVYELFIDLFLSFPKAVWILTTRPSDDWAKARLQQPDAFWLSWPIQEPCVSLASRPLLGGRPSQKNMASMFSLGNDLIRCMVAPEKLMEIDVFTKPTDGLMVDLGNFLAANGYTSKNMTLFLEGEAYPHIKASDLPGTTCNFWSDLPGLPDHPGAFHG